MSTTTFDQAPATTADLVCGVTVTAAKHPRIADLTRRCGQTFRYETHTDIRQTAIRVACLCPDGHGLSRVPWRGWISTAEAAMTLTDIPRPGSTYAIREGEPEDAEVIHLDRIGTPVPATRAA